MGDYTFGTTALVSMAAALYLLPSIIAVIRGRRPLTVFAINLFGGWTIAGWFWSLFLALW